MRKITILLITAFMALTISGWGQTTTIDFETEGDGYTPSATEGSGYTDVFNRSNPDIGGNASYMWCVEDLSLTNPSITLDQIDVTSGTSFTFSIDMIAHHYNDWDGTDELLITYSLDGGAFQNLMWVQMIPEGDANGATNEPAALDTGFDGAGECSDVLPALSMGAGSQGCTVTSNTFETFTTSSIALSGNSTLDIFLQFIGLTSGDEGIYLDEITIIQTGGTATPLITVTPSSLSGFSYIEGSGPSAEQSFTVEGADLTADIYIAPSTNYEISTGTGGSFSATDPITLTQSGGSVSTTPIYVRLKADLSAGDYNNNEDITASSSGATDKTVSCSGTVLEQEPDNHATGFTATKDSWSKITVDWTDAVPAADYYLIKASDESYAAIVAPVDGTAEADGSLVQNVAVGGETFQFTGLGSSTTYYFRIYAYNGTGSTVNYKTDGSIPEANATTDDLPAAPNVFFSEYIEGSSNNKAIEIYNASGVTVDLDNFAFPSVSNAPTVAGQYEYWNNFAIGATIAPGEVYVVAHPSANAAILAEADETYTYLSNGDDGFALVYGTEPSYQVLDWIGNWDGDPGSGWDVAGVTAATKDHTLLRKLSTSSGNTDWASSAGTDASNSEWIVLGQDYSDNLGYFGASATEWTGSAKSNEWHNASNWTNGVPDATKIVTIPPTDNDPYIFDSGKGMTYWAACLSLDIQSGASLTIDYNSNLTVLGTFVNDGSLTLESEGEYAASLIHNTPGVTADVQRGFGIDLGDGWHLGSSPVVAATSTVFDGFYLQSYDETTNNTPPMYGYSEITELGVSLNVFEGYAFYPGESTPEMVTFSGIMNVGQFDATLTAANQYGWNLLGNPYPCSINWDLVTIPDNMSNEVQLLDAYNNDFVEYVQGVPGNNFIPPMQGFFVSATAAETFSIDNNVKTHDGSDMYYKSEIGELLELMATGDKYSDKITIHFNENAGIEHDGQFDAHKRISSNNPELPQIFSITPAGEYLAINGIPATELVSVGFKAGMPGVFTVEALETGVFATVILEDLLTGIQTDLINESYTFNYDVADADHRFNIHFAPLSVSENAADLFTVYAYNDEVIVTSIQGENNAQIYVYNVMGQEIATAQLSGNVSKLKIANSATYIVKVVSEQGVVSKKVFIK